MHSLITTCLFLTDHYHHPLGVHSMVCKLAACRHFTSCRLFIACRFCERVGACCIESLPVGFVLSFVLVLVLMFDRESPPVGVVLWSRSWVTTRRFYARLCARVGAFVWSRVTTRRRCALIRNVRISPFCPYLFCLFFCFTFGSSLFVCLFVCLFG